MGEALDMVKKKINLEGPAKQETPPQDKEMDELEKALRLVDGLDAKDMIRSRVREIKANAELRAEEAIARASQLRGGIRTIPAEQETKNQIAETAVKFLDANIDPKVVGQFILSASGMAGGANIPITSPAAPGQQITMADLIQFATFLTTSKTDNGTTELIKEMRDEIRTLRSQPAQSPVDPVNQLVSLLAQLRQAKLVPDDTPPATGEPLEVVKERNRHAEAIEEIKNKKEHDAVIGEAIQSIPEAIARGAGAQIRDRAAAPAKRQAPGKPLGRAENEVYSFACEKCGTVLFATPGATRITCGKCKQVYGAPGTFEPGEVAQPEPEKE